MILTITSNLAEISARLGTAGAQIVAVITEGVVGLTEESAGILTSEVRAATPEVSGALTDSTTPVTEVSGMSGKVEIFQPAESLPNSRGLGGGFPYVLSVIGGRRAITSADFLPGTKALYIPGVGFRMSTKPGKANDYNDRAAARALPQIESLSAFYGEEMLAKVVQTI